MKIVFLLAAAVFFLASGGAAGEEPAGQMEMHYRSSLEHDFIYNRVTGPGADRSILTPKWTYQTLFYLDAAGRVSDIDVVNFSLGLKSTDDRRVDSRDISVVTLRGTASNDHFVLNLGDTFESFSPYSLSGPVKGGSLRMLPSGEPGGFQLVAVHGIAYPRWDNYRSSSPALRRQVSGVRAHVPILGNRADLGLSFVNSTDSEPVFAGQSLFDNRVIAADLEAELIPGLTLRLESAHASADESDGAAPIGDHDGTAHRIELVGQGGPSRVQLEYERVSAGFHTSMGSAVSDRERYRARWRYRVNPDVTLTSAFLYYHDDLSGNTGTRTNHYKPEIGLSWRNPGGRTFGVLDLRYRYDKARSATRDTNDHTITLGHRDRFGIFDFDGNLGYTHFDTANQRNTKDYTYNVGLSSRHDRGNFVFRPRLNLGGWTSRDGLADESDQVWENSFGLGIEMPERNLNTEIRLGRYELIKDAPNADSKRHFASLRINHRPARWQETRRVMFTLQAGYNDYNFDAPNLDYREVTGQFGLRMEL